MKPYASTFRWFTYFAGEVLFFRTRKEFREYCKNHSTIHNWNDLRSINDMTVDVNSTTHIKFKDSHKILNVRSDDELIAVNKVWTVMSTGAVLGVSIHHPLPPVESLKTDARNQGRIDREAGKAIQAFGDWRDDEGYLVDAYLDGYNPDAKIVKKIVTEEESSLADFIEDKTIQVQETKTFKDYIHYLMLKTHDFALFEVYDAKTARELEETISEERYKHVATFGNVDGIYHVIYCSRSASLLEW